MKELLIIAIGAAVVNNVVLSQFLGLCPFFGVSKKIETAAGMGGAGYFRYYPVFPGNQLNLPVYSGSSGYELYADHCVYFSNCSPGSVCGDVFKESHAASVCKPWRLSSFDYNKLCSTGNCHYQCSEVL